MCAAVPGLGDVYKDSIISTIVDAKVGFICAPGL